jgi:hypothetical protein
METPSTRAEITAERLSPARQFLQKTATVSASALRGKLTVDQYAEVVRPKRTGHICLCKGTKGTVPPPSLTDSSWHKSPLWQCRTVSSLFGAYSTVHSNKSAISLYLNKYRANQGSLRKRFRSGLDPTHASLSIQPWIMITTSNSS